MPTKLLLSNIYYTLSLSLYPKKSTTLILPPPAAAGHSPSNKLICILRSEIIPIKFCWLSQRNIFKNVRNNFSGAAVARCRLLPAAAGGENHLWSFRGMFTNCIRLVCVKNLSIAAKNLQLIWVKYPNHIIIKKNFKVLSIRIGGKIEEVWAFPYTLAVGVQARCISKYLHNPQLNNFNQ